MSWLDRVNDNLIIKTGDGKEYKPYWTNAEKEIQYNTSGFEFVNKRGTLVHRGTDKGGIYNLELHFQGEDNIEVSRRFEISARDRRPWEISHPYYDSIFVQPAVLRIDNRRHNVTIFNIHIIETITDKLPTSSVSPQDKIINDHAALIEATATQFATEEITTSDIAQLAENNQTLFDKAKNAAGAAIDSYYNAFKTANNAVTQATTYPLNAMRSVQTFINAPARFKESVESRINTLLQQAQILRAKITNLTTRGDKVIYEATVSGITGSIAVASVTDPDYTTVSQTVSARRKLNNQFNTFLTELDGLQSSTGGQPGYVPNPEIIQRLESLVNFTVSNLNNVALNQRSEHRVFLEEDSNIILLAHRFYGLDANDNNLDDFINHNEFGLNEMLVVKKGREVKYFI